MLQDPKALLDRLFNFDKDNIPDKVIQAKRRGHIEEPSHSVSSRSFEFDACLQRLYPFSAFVHNLTIWQAITPYMEREDFDPAAIKKV